MAYLGYYWIGIDFYYF